MSRICLRVSWTRDSKKKIKELSAKMGWNWKNKTCMLRQYETSGFSSGLEVITPVLITRKKGTN